MPNYSARCEQTKDFNAFEGCFNFENSIEKTGEFFTIFGHFTFGWMLECKDVHLVTPKKAKQSFENEEIELLGHQWYGPISTSLFEKNKALIEFSVSRCSRRNHSKISEFNRIFRLCHESMCTNKTRHNFLNR